MILSEFVHTQTIENYWSLVKPCRYPVAGDHAGEAPGPQEQGSEIVEPDNQPIDEPDQNYWAIVEHALAIDEPDPATSILADIEAALGLGELRLIGTKIEDAGDKPAARANTDYPREANPSANMRRSLGADAANSSPGSTSADQTDSV